MPPYTDTTETVTEDTESEDTLSLLEEFLDGFAWEKRDKRLDGFPLMSSIWPSIYICLLYIFLVKVVGPKLMRERDALKLDLPVGCYNSIQFMFELLVIPWLSVYYFSEGNGWGKED